MEILHADHAILLATLSCVILPLLYFVIYVFLQQRWNLSPDALPEKKKPMTYRIGRIPKDWDKTGLENYLKKKGVDLDVKSLALDIGGNDQMATGTVEDAPSSPLTDHHLILDDHFYGVTTLYIPSPENHKIDILAISGLGGHAFGSFKSRKEASHMWLRDDLPKDIPMARIMTYGYNSRVADSNSYDNLATLANRFNLSFLGGLIVKQAMIELSRSEGEETAKLYKSVYGIVFFGVPHQGMDVKPLRSMAGNGPNRSLIESIAWTNSMNTEELSRSF